jgi:DNA-binding LytR/AlgR family response regulator
LQILLTHKPTRKFATHLLLADTQENFTYMNFDFSKQKEKKLPIKEKAQTSLLRYDEILYLECTGNLVFVYHSQNESPFSYSNSLINIETELAQYGFLRINHNKLVNMYHVQNLNSNKHEIRISSSKILTVSRRKWQNIKEFFNS